MTTQADERSEASASDEVVPERLAVGDVFRLGLLGISTRKLRAGLSAAGIAIGIATVIVVIGIPASSQAALLDRLSELGTNVLRAQPVPQKEDPVKLPTDAAERVERIGPVTGVATVANTHKLVRRNNRTDPYSEAGLTVLARIWAWRSGGSSSMRTMWTERGASSASRT